MTIRAALDACVLYPAGLRDTLLGAAVAGAFVPSWSAGTVDEMIRNLIEHGRMTPEGAKRTAAAMRGSFLTAEVSDAPIPGDLPGVPVDDWHVAAAAVVAKADYLVTSNLQDFPSVALAPFGVLPVNPDAFLLMLHQRFPADMVEIIRQQQAKLRRPPVPMEDVLQLLALTAPGFVALVRPHLL